HLRWVFGHVQINFLIATTEGPAVVAAFLQSVDLLGWPVITPAIAGMVPAIELAIQWVPGKANGVAQPFGVDLQTVYRQVRLVRVEPYQGRIEGVGFGRGIGGTADG